MPRRTLARVSTSRPACPAFRHLLKVRTANCELRISHLRHAKAEFCVGDHVPHKYCAWLKFEATIFIILSVDSRLLSPIQLKRCWSNILAFHLRLSLQIRLLQFRSKSIKTNTCIRLRDRYNMNVSNTYANGESYFRLKEHSNVILAHIALMSIGWAFVLPLGEYLRRQTSR